MCYTKSFSPMPQACLFDTLAFSKKLKTAGMPDLQAEACAEVLFDVLKILLEQLSLYSPARSPRIDTLAFVKRLTAVGMPQIQAEVQLEGMVQVLATRDYIYQMYHHRADVC
jgi:hypothetical protein